MTRFQFFLGIFIIGIISINTNLFAQSESLIIINGDTIQPQVDIKVNRQLDENGNVIGYDSTYSSFFSYSTGPGGEMIMNDSLFFDFPSFGMDLESHSFFPENMDEFMNDKFENDEFFRDRFFESFNKRMEEMDMMMRSMDTLMYRNMPPPQYRNYNPNPYQHEEKEKENINQNNDFKKEEKAEPVKSKKHTNGMI